MNQVASPIGPNPRPPGLAGIGDERVLAVISATPRAGFVPADYVNDAYHDEPIPIGHRQVTTQPSLSARMIEGLHLLSRRPRARDRHRPGLPDRACWPAWPPA